jgi:hypothetical protein
MRHVWVMRFIGVALGLIGRPKLNGSCLLGITLIYSATHDARSRIAAAIDRGRHHLIGSGLQALLPGGIEPVVEQSERIDGQWFWQEQELFGLP